MEKHSTTGEVIEKLAEYEELEDQGKLHKTQVAIGQTVYTNLAMSGWYLRDKDRPYKAKVVFIGLNDSEEMGYGFFNVAYEKSGCMMHFNFSDIGKTVFLTEEDAKQALVEMKTLNAASAQPVVSDDTKEDELVLKSGCDSGGTYEYYDILDYDKCCTCAHFSDNWHEERFECLNKNRKKDGACYESE